MRPPRLGWLQGFLLASAALIGTVVIVSGLAVGRFFERQALIHEEEHTAKIIQVQARQHLTKEDLRLPPPGAEPPAVGGFLPELPGVFRIKVYDRTGRIIWSDEPRLIGVAFPDDLHLARALKGKVTTVFRVPRGSENVYERTRGYVLETYVPITLPGSPVVVRVIETYRDATHLALRIRRTQHLIWGAAGGIGLLLYVALGFVVWKASAKERRAIGRLETQKRELGLLHTFAHSLLQPVGGQILQSLADQPIPPHRLAGSVVERIGIGLDLARASLCQVRDGLEPALLADWAAQGVGAWIPPPQEIVTRAIQTRCPVVQGAMVIVALFTPKDPAYLCDPSRCPSWICETSPLADSTYLFHATFKRPISAGESIPVALEIMLQEVAIALANLELFAEIHEAHERLAAILAAIADRMTIVDRQMRIVWMNAAAADSLDRGADSLGLYCFQVLGAEPEACEGCPAVRTFLSGAIQRGVRAQRLPGRELRYLDLVTAPLHDASGQVHQVLEVARDITERVEMENRLKQSAASLEESHAALLAKTEELEQVNDALRDTQAQLVEQERLAAAGQVVVGLHHAILNPLTGILGALQLLKQEGLARPEKAEALAEAEAEIRKIEQLIRRLPTLRRAAGTPYVGDTTMLDLERSCAEEERT